MSEVKDNLNNTSLTLLAGPFTSVISKKSPAATIDISCESEKISKVMSDSILDVRDFGTCAPAIDDIDRYFKSSSRH